MKAPLCRGCGDWGGFSCPLGGRLSHREALQLGRWWRVRPAAAPRRTRCAHTPWPFRPDVPKCLFPVHCNQPDEALPLLCSSLQLPATVLSSACLARPPVALTWAPQGALPAKQWRPGRRDPPSGRGRMPAVEQGAQDVRPQRALGGCGDSTQRTHQGSKWALFQYW